MSEESRTPDSFKPLRRTVEAYRQGDLDAHMNSYAPDAVLDMSARGLGIFVGREAIRGFWEDYYRSFDDLKFELEQGLDLGSGVMFAVVRQMLGPPGAADACGRARPGSAFGRRASWSEGPATPTRTRPVLPPNASPRNGRSRSPTGSRRGADRPGDRTGLHLARRPVVDDP